MDKKLDRKWSTKRCEVQQGNGKRRCSVIVCNIRPTGRQCRSCQGRGQLDSAAPQLLLFVTQLPSPVLLPHKIRHTFPHARLCSVRRSSLSSMPLCCLSSASDSVSAPLNSANTTAWKSDTLSSFTPLGTKGTGSGGAGCQEGGEPLATLNSPNATA